VSDPIDMIMPMLREMRTENAARFDGVDTRLDLVQRRLESLEAAQQSFKQALAADSLLSKLVTGEFEKGIGVLEAKVRELEGRR
jgi:hypothetical protein